MKTIPSILLVIAALLTLSLTGCEYYNETPGYVRYDGGHHGTEISSPSDEAVHPATETDQPEIIVPEEEPTTGVDPATEGPADDTTTAQDERPWIQATAEPTDMLVVVGGLNTEKTFAERVRDAKELSLAPQKMIATLTPPTFGIEHSSYTLQLRERGGLNDGGSCRGNPPGGPEVGVSLQTKLKHFDDGHPTLLTDISLGCRKTEDWLNPDQTDRIDEWNNGIRYEETLPPEGSFDDEITFPVGRALVGIKLFRCYADNTSIAPEFCGLAGLFRAVHRDGTMEDGDLEEIQIPRQENYVRSRDFETVIRCAEPDEVVTGLRFRQPDASEDSPVTWVEFFCSRIVK